MADGGGGGGLGAISAKQRGLRFLVTGTTGFIVDAVVLTLLTGIGVLGPAAARGISFPSALLVTWAMNRAWAFGDRERPRVGRELAGYVAIQLTSFAVNYVIFLALVEGWFGAKLAPVPALAVASIAAAALTYVLLNAGLYRRRSETPSPR